MLVLRNVRIVPSNVRKKKKKPLNVTKIQSRVILVLYNMKIVSSNVRKKKGTIKCDKNTVTFDIGIVQCEDGIIKYEKK